MYICHACKKALDIGREIGRRDECSFCHADLHCCLNCRFHDPAAPKQCREPVAEPVKTKHKANFCDYFVFRDTDSSTKDDASKARQALDNLFRK